jgi:hypothetical protein
MKHAEKLDTSLLRGRKFQLWHYIVSHGHLLIRSGIDNRETTNIDISFTAVTYVEVPRHLGEITLDEPTDEERARLKARTDKFYDDYQTTVIVSGLNRFYVVSSWVSIEENQLDLFDAPYGNVGWLPQGFDTSPKE